MMEATSDLKRGLPIVVTPLADEVLSSWLTRIAQDYFVPPRSLLTHMGLSAPSLERLDVSLTFGQANAISAFVHRPPDAILDMTHVRLPRDCQKLVRLKHPQQTCRTCALQHKRDGAATAVLKSWMQGWRMTCRKCGGLLDDVWTTCDDAPPFAGLREAARAGEGLIETYAGREQRFPISPATMMRLLLLRRRPTPEEFRKSPGEARHVIGTLIADFDEVVDDHGLSNLLGRTLVLPMRIRIAILAALATVMADPIAQLSKLRQSRAFGPQFDRVLEQDPILTPMSLFADILPEN
jgi:TniQ